MTNGKEIRRKSPKPGSEEELVTGKQEDPVKPRRARPSFTRETRPSLPASEHEDDFNEFLGSLLDENGNNLNVVEDINKHRIEDVVLMGPPLSSKSTNARYLKQIFSDPEIIDFDDAIAPVLAKSTIEPLLWPEDGHEWREVHNNLLLLLSSSVNLPVGDSSSLKRIIMVPAVSPKPDSFKYGTAFINEYILKRRQDNKTNRTRFYYCLPFRSILESGGKLRVNTINAVENGLSVSSLPEWLEKNYRVRPVGYNPGDVNDMIGLYQEISHSAPDYIARFVFNEMLRSTDQMSLTYELKKIRIPQKALDLLYLGKLEGEDISNLRRLIYFAKREKKLLGFSSRSQEFKILLNFPVDKTILWPKYRNYQSP